MDKLWTQRKKCGHFFMKTFTKLIYFVNWRQYTTREASFDSDARRDGFCVAGKRVGGYGARVCNFLEGKIHLVVAPTLNSDGNRFFDNNGDRFFNENGLRNWVWHWVCDWNCDWLRDRNLKHKMSKFISNWEVEDNSLLLSILIFSDNYTHWLIFFIDCFCQNKKSMIWIRC